MKGAVTGTASGSLNPDVMADCWSAVSWRLISSVACRSGHADVSERRVQETESKVGTKSLHDRHC